MPFYEYECQACKFYSEVMQKITDPPLTKCPSCGKKKLKKLVSAPVFRLKGGGWYETDFKGDKENKRNLVGSDRDEPKAEAKTEGKSDKTDGKDKKPETPAPAKEAKPVEKAVPAAARARRPAKSRKAKPAPRKARR